MLSVTFMGSEHDIALRSVVYSCLIAQLSSRYDGDFDMLKVP